MIAGWQQDRGQTEGVPQGCLPLSPANSRAPPSLCTQAQLRMPQIRAQHSTAGGGADCELPSRRPGGRGPSHPRSGPAGWLQLPEPRPPQGHGPHVEACCPTTPACVELRTRETITHEARKAGVEWAVWSRAGRRSALLIGFGQKRMGTPSLCPLNTHSQGDDFCTCTARSTK